MTVDRPISRRSLTAALTIALAAMATTAAVAGPSSPGASRSVFAIDAGAKSRAADPNTAAIVDGHMIPMTEVVSMCLLNDRSYVIDQMVQSYVVDRECKRRGITASEKEIDADIAALRKTFAPATLEETLRQHQWTMEQLRQEYRRKIETSLLIADQVKAMPMAHCHEILVKCRPTDATRTDIGSTRSEADALAIIGQIQAQLKQGKPFEQVSARYSEGDPKLNGDLGVLYGNMLNVEATVLTAAMALHKGEISPTPVRTADGYCLIEATSTSDNHPGDENSLYADADSACRKLQVMFLSPKVVDDLIHKSKRTYVPDAALAPGKPLPHVAATIDGHPILMQDVLAKCLADTGPNSVDILVQNYVVDRECAKRGIRVSSAEIDQLVDKLRRQMAPHSLAEGLAIHHTTMEGLRADFRQQIERAKLVLDQVPATKMVHAQAILVNDPEAGNSGPTPVADNGNPTARTMAMQIRNQLIGGASFEELAKHYADQGNTRIAGDVGILYEGMHGVDTALLQTAVSMKTGEVTPNPVRTNGGYLLLQIVSTLDNHPASEDASYAAADRAYREQEAQKLEPQAIVALLKHSRVTYFVHR